jgi:hypothetical protein
MAPLTTEQGCCFADVEFQLGNELVHSGELALSSHGPRPVLIYWL